MGHDDSEQPTLFLTYDKLRGLGHPFYDALGRLLREQGFDRFVDGLCEPHYAEVMGRPGLAPGVYFRCLLIGYFEGIGADLTANWPAGGRTTSPRPSSVSLTLDRQALQLNSTSAPWSRPSGPN